MGKPDIITTPSGDRMVILPEAEFRALAAAAEDAADVRAYDKAKQRLNARESELVPSEIVDRLLGGENRIRVWRDHRGMTAAELARKAGIARAYLTQIENGKRAGAVATIRKLAKALRVEVDDLI
jgi:DNA-binding XRE family transcriptional regulator